MTSLAHQMLRLHHDVHRPITKERVAVVGVGGFPELALDVRAPAYDDPGAAWARQPPDLLGGVPVLECLLSGDDAALLGGDRLK
jgi:hypothetical protein